MPNHSLRRGRLTPPVKAGRRYTKNELTQIKTENRAPLRCAKMGVEVTESEAVEITAAILVVSVLLILVDTGGLHWFAGTMIYHQIIKRHF